MCKGKIVSFFIRRSSFRECTRIKQADLVFTGTDTDAVTLCLHCRFSHAYWDTEFNHRHRFALLTSLFGGHPKNYLLERWFRRQLIQLCGIHWCYMRCGSSCPLLSSNGKPDHTCD